MQVKFVFGPNAGSTAHVPRDQFIDILLRAGVLELADEVQSFNVKPALSAGPQYKVGLSPAGTLVCVVRILGAQTEYFDGAPEAVKQWRADVPDGIIAEYQRRRG